MEKRVSLNGGLGNNKQFKQKQKILQLSTPRTVSLILIL